MSEIKKVSDTEIEITDTQIISERISLDGLLAQKADIEGKIAEQRQIADTRINALQIELNAVDDKISTAKTLGVKIQEEVIPTPIEVIPE